MATSNQYALSRINRNGAANFSRAMRQVVPPFLQKLYEMVDDHATDDLIRWSDTGDSFFVLDRERVAQDVLPRWFKHNNFSSFVRQLNMYGFHKIPHLQQGVLKSDSETEAWNFEHPNFHRGQPDLLCLISRKKPASERTGEDGHSENPDNTSNVAPTGTSSNTVLDVNAIISGIAAIKRHQTTISADLNELKRSNQHLWQEAMAARERHKQHQDTINRILKFLAGVFGNAASSSKSSPNPSHTIPRKRQRLMIENTQQDNDKASLGENVFEDEHSDVEHNFDETDGQLETSSRFTVLENTPMESLPSSLQSPATASADSNPYFYGQAIGQSIKSADIFPEASIAPSLLSNTSTPNYAATPYSDREPTPIATHDTAPPKMNMLTSSTPPNGQDPLMQAVINSPAQIQRLFAALAQQNVSMPPPSDLPPEYNTGTQSYINLPPTTVDTADLSNYSYQPQMENSAVADSPFVAIAPSGDEYNHQNWSALLDDNNQLQKQYKDVKDVSAGVDAIQDTIDSFMERLGISPDVIHNYQGHMNNVEHDGSDFISSEGNILNGDQFKPAGSDIDFDSFLTQFDSSNVDPGSLDDYTSQFNSISQAGPADSTQNKMGAFLDEITSQSDASSPSAHRVSIDDPPLEQSTQKRGQKRKSDIIDPQKDSELLSGKIKR